MTGPLLEVKDLVVEFYTEGGIVRANDGVSINLDCGETLGVVGESGCGKSVMALSIMGLLPPAGKIIQGKVLFQGEDLLKMSEKKLREIRGRDISMIFQEPMTSLNPVYTIGSQLTEAIILHQKVSKKEAYNRALEIMEKVSIPLPRQRIKEYPHQLSGGMRQRIMIAMAIVCHPKILIADEPTTALDVTIQAQILNLMLKLKEELGTAVILITHDFGVVAEFAKWVVVMYAGKVVEEGEVRSIFEKPLHPYTQGLLKSIPSIDKKKGKLHVIKGSVPNPLDMPTGCSFHPRCPFCDDICRELPPGLKKVAFRHYARCWMIPEEVQFD